MDLLEKSVIEPGVSKLPSLIENFTLWTYIMELHYRLGRLVQKYQIA